jgi:hypothetical protein
VVNFDGGTRAMSLTGTLVDVRITASFDYSLRGELLSDSAAQCAA